MFDCGAVPAEPDRERAVRPREGQLHRRDDDARRACSSRPTAARCSSTSSASCRSICSPSSCARSSSARSAASAATKPQQGRRPHHRGDQPQPRGRGRAPAGSARICSIASASCALHLPSLRERTDDIPLLVQHFLETRHVQPQRRTASRGSAASSRDAMTALQNYPWPGNVRELVNVDRARGLVLRAAS